MFLIELNDQSKEITQFNLLLKDWINSLIPIELAAILPHSSTAFNYGWISPRNFISEMPVINFYYQTDIKSIQQIEHLKNINKFFFASKDFSIDLINDITSSDTPSVIITTNENYIKNIYNCHIILAKDKSTDEILKETYRCLLKVFDGYISFDGENPINNKFLNGYILKKEFLPEVEVTPNLLCTANEIVFSHVRGKLPKYLNYEESEILDLEDCYYKNQRLAYEIISERFLDMLLGIHSGKSKYPGELPDYFKHKLNYFIENENRLSNSTKRRIYESMKKDIINFKHFDALDEFTIVIPSINDFCRENFFNNTLAQFNGKYKKEIKDIINAILSGGKGIPFPIPEVEEEKFLALSKIIGHTRKSEIRFLTYLTAIYASRKLSPVLRTTTVPSSLFTDIRIFREKIHGLSLMKKREDEDNIYRPTGEYFERMQLKMGYVFPRVYHELLRNSNIPRCTIFSDIPFELMIHQQQVFCHKYPVTRIPLTPLSLLVHYNNQYAEGPAFGIKFSSFKQILMINAISESDLLFKEYMIFEMTCKEQGYDLNFKSVSESKEFINLVNDENPNILIYFGHAFYDDIKDIGYLKFKNDTLSHDRFGEINIMPKIVFLVGCETASSAAFSGGLSNWLLKFGVWSILATLFPIPADPAGSFIGRLLGIIGEAKKAERKYSLAELVFKARKLGWLRDRLDALYHEGIITTYEELLLLNEIVDPIMQLSLERKKELVPFEAEHIFEQVLQKHGILDDWNRIKSKTIPYSLFFTLLGGAHDVYFTE